VSGSGKTTLLYPQNICIADKVCLMDCTIVYTMIKLIVKRRRAPKSAEECRRTPKSAEEASKERRH